MIFLSAFRMLLVQLWLGRSRRSRHLVTLCSTRAALEIALLQDDRLAVAGAAATAFTVPGAVVRSAPSALTWQWTWLWCATVSLCFRWLRCGDWRRVGRLPRHRCSSVSSYKSSQTSSRQLTQLRRLWQRQQARWPPMIWLLRLLGQQLIKLPLRTQQKIAVRLCAAFLAGGCRAQRPLSSSIPDSRRHPAVTEAEHKGEKTLLPIMPSKYDDFHYRFKFATLIVEISMVYVHCTD